MSENIRYDAVRVRAEITEEGYLRDTPVVARAGIQVYRRQDGSTRREYRPPEVVFAADSLAALAGVPIIDTHIGMMRADNVRQHAIGTVLSHGRQDGDSGNMVADIIIHDPTPVTRHGRKELSLAYSVRCDETPGTTPDGESYDARVVAITRYNHLALVERGRAGVAKLRLDSEDAVSTDIENVEITDSEDDTNMSNGNPGGNNPPSQPPRQFVSIRVDGLDYPAAPEVERAFQRLNGDLTAATKRADTAEAERDAARQTISGHDTALAQVRADTAAQVRQRITLEGVAKDHSVEVRADDSDRNIRENVIRKIDADPGARFDGKSDDYVSALFDQALIRAKDSKRQKDANRAAVNGAGQTAAARADGIPVVPVINGTPAINSARAARDAMVRRGRL